MLLSIFKRTVSSLVVVVTLLILFNNSYVARPVQAASGDMLRSIFVNPIPACGYFSAGVAFDGNELLISCVFSNVITRVSPVDGRNLGSLTIDGISPSEGITAMSWDAQNGRLWVGSATVVPQKIYTVTLDKVRHRGTATFRFTHTETGGESWLDGLAFDPTDGTIWLGPDGQTQVYHYTQAGTLLDSFSVAEFAPFGKSGIVVGSPTKLYVANDGDSQIFYVNKDGTSPTLFANVPANKRVEDLECDNVTFAPKSVIWSKYSFDNYELNAYEVPAGECFLETRGKILNVPLLKQNDLAWGESEYDNAKTQFTWCGKTMAQCGCVTTSIAMILDYYDVKNPDDGSNTTPATVNEYFKLDRKPAMCTDGSGKFVAGWQSRGYFCANVVWKAAAQYSRDAFIRNRADSMINLLNSGPIAYDAKTLRDDINLNTPVILQNTAQNHWFVAKGIIDNTFFINDPFFSRTRLDDPAYGNSARQTVRYVKVSSDFSAFVVPIESPDQLLITDSDGRRTGFDPATLTVVQEITNSTYYFQQSLADDTGQNTPTPDGVGSYWVSIDTPQAGDYKIQVISPPREAYSFGVYAYDHDADLTLNSFVGQSTSDVPPSYIFSYNPIHGVTTISYQVLIDIKPGEDINPINLKSKGVIPVVILSTDMFDATTIDALSVKFGPSSAGETHKRGHIEDVNGDGKPDIVLHFATQQTGITNGTTEACLTGKTTNGLEIKGCDTIHTVQLSPKS